MVLERHETGIKITMQLPIETLTAEAFAPFGQVIEKPAASSDATGPGWMWWGETATLAPDSRPYGIGYLDLQPAPLSFDWAERHMRSDEMLIPTDDCLIYVGPADHLDEPGRAPVPEQFRVFEVKRGQAVVLHPGVWHGAPLALDRPTNVVVLLLRGTGASDTSIVRWDAPVLIQPHDGGISIDM
jgi:ureidoglycolate lyase